MPAFHSRWPEPFRPAQTPARTLGPVAASLQATTMRTSVGLVLHLLLVPSGDMRPWRKMDTSFRITSAPPDLGCDTGRGHSTASTRGWCLGLAAKLGEWRLEKSVAARVLFPLRSLPPVRL